MECRKSFRITFHNFLTFLISFYFFVLFFFASISSKFVIFAELAFILSRIIEMIFFPFYHFSFVFLFKTIYILIKWKTSYCERNDLQTQRSENWNKHFKNWIFANFLILIWRRAIEWTNWGNHWVPQVIWFWELQEDLVYRTNASNECLEEPWIACPPWDDIASKNTLQPTKPSWINLSNEKLPLILTSRFHSIGTKPIIFQ